MTVERKRVVDVKVNQKGSSKIKRKAHRGFKVSGRVPLGIKGVVLFLVGY